MSSSETRVKTKHIMVRVSPEEKETIEEQALDAGLTAPAFLRALGLNKRVTSKADKHLVNELRKLGGLQKHLFNEGRGVLSKEYAQILVEIQKAIARIDGQ
ncbi:mobilization protein (plasmid) [Stutzerimonas stutzeri]|uniref:plasmid mobilization protein MobA n=1 Tax=Stutzerimonas stutzeri TaxID=316 RepID=UPI001BAE8F66|nr:plasmid mobilization protein MobA [Stutzerimonas stutzeri]QUE78416.1 mobilization protein [Stutzerimonas stutzeri]